MDSSGKIRTISQEEKPSARITNWIFKNAFDLNSSIIASAVFGYSLVGAIVNFYYIKVFLTVYYLNGRWLNVVQILFAVWNAVNDPIFGFLQDVGLSSCPKWFMNRRKVVLYVGPIFALSSMIFWIPWSATGEPSWLVGLHLLVALFLHDTLLTFALSAECGLFTECTTKHQGRVRMAVYLEIAGLMGGLAILPVDAISKSLNDFRAFQIAVAVVAVLAAIFFLITGLFASDLVAQTNELDDNAGEDKPKTTAEGFRGGYEACKAILRNRDFLCVVMGNFFHKMRTIGGANLLAIFTEALLSLNGVLAVGSMKLSLFYTGCTVLPKVFFILCWPMLLHYGTYVSLMVTSAISAVICIVTVILGRTYYGWLAMFFLLESILSTGISAVYSIFFPDIIDEDMVRHKRKSPMSTLIFTMNALITKPAQSIAPMVIVAILNGAGYDKYIAAKKPASGFNSTSISNYTNLAPFDNLSITTTGHNSTLTTADPEQFEHLFSTMFYVACLYPLACIILEAICLLPYKLKFRHKRESSTGVVSSVADPNGHADGRCDESLLNAKV